MTSLEMISTNSSAGGSRLCHICGVGFAKASLPSHQKSCIRKSFGMIQMTRQMATFSAGMVIHHPCSHCMQRIPTHKMNSHLRTCQGQGLEPPRVDFEKTHFEKTNTVPHSAPIRRHRTSKMDSGGMVSAAFEVLEEKFYEREMVELEEFDTRAYSASSSVLPRRTLKDSRPNTLALMDEMPSKKNSFSRSQDSFEIPDKIQSLDDDEEVVELTLNPCDICSRKFKPDRLEKHMAACSKASKSRKVFDGSTARIKGTEMEQYAVKGKKNITTVKDREPPQDVLPIKKKPLKKMGSIREKVMANDVSDYVTCPGCSRKFAQESGARHIPICTSKSSVPSWNAKKSSDTLLKKRVEYRPPLSKPSSRK